MSPFRSRLVPWAVLAVLAGVLVVVWWWPNRPVAADVPMPTARFNSLSFAPYRAFESPLTRTFPTAREVDADLALVATRSRGIRTYSALEGNYDLPAMARAHHLKMWLGIWLGGDRQANEKEMAAGIADAIKYPDVVERVVVGNEVLLRRDLPPDELIADIDRVRRAIHQPVTYADVWNFFLANPQVVPHLDYVSIHILPYWEDQPTNIGGAMKHVQQVLERIRRRFPRARIAIGETGWPSRGRWRQDAAPSLVNEAVFLRRFISLAQAEGIDYNFIEAFDEDWKYHNEGVVGANWGLWTAARCPKFPLYGAVQENAGWPVPAALGVVCGLLLYVQASVSRRLAPLARPRLAALAMVLGGALSLAWAGVAQVLFDRLVVLAAIGNLAGQATLALLFMQRLARNAGVAAPMPRTGRDASRAALALLRGARPAGWSGTAWHEAAFEDLSFLFVWTAALLQLLLWYDPRYRDFPVPTFAVPVVVTVARLLMSDLPRGGGGREEAVVAGMLVLGAVGSGIQEGPLNLQSLVWNACAVVLALPVLARLSGEAGKPWSRVR